jgi:hypothetical protein
MVGGFLFLNGSGNTTSWLVGAPNPSFGVGRYSHVQLGALHWPGCTIHCAMGSRGVVRMSTSEVTRPPTDLDVGVFLGR